MVALRGDPAAPSHQPHPEQSVHGAQVVARHRQPVVFRAAPDGGYCANAFWSPLLAAAGALKPKPEKEIPSRGLGTPSHRDSLGQPWQLTAESSDQLHDQPYVLKS